ncbi:MAG TPA: hypothetical protein VIM73_17350, partial [Polyangiaceae bacterium]
MARTRSRFLELCLLGNLSCLFACSEAVRHPPVEVDCTADDAYELKRITAWERTEMLQWFNAADPTPGAVATYTTGDPYPSDACGTAPALHVIMSGNQDWGSIVGSWGVLGAEGDASGYDGLSFWAKAEYAKHFLILLSDKQTDEEALVPVEEGGCDPNAGIDENGVSRPEECGNHFQVRVTVTDRWHFYTLPWRQFFQEDRPNRREGIDPATIHKVILRGQKDSVLDLW